LRKVLINKLQPGMILGKTIFSPNGHVLLSTGSELNETFIRRLQALGYTAVLVQENYCEGLAFNDIVSDRSRIDSTIALRNIFDETRKIKKLDTKAIKSMVNTFVDEIIQNRNLLFELPDIRSYDNYLHGHCVNVCILAIRIGMLLEYNEIQLRDLGIGAVLHDIGMVFVNREVLERPGKLSASEFEQVKQHSITGFNLLREQKDVNLLSAHVSFQHHEKIDGSGYPRLLKRDEICEFARIVAVADLFDALTSERKHRKSYAYSEAIKIIREEAGQKIDLNMAELLLKNIAIHPTGSLVQLNSGEVGLVVANFRQDPENPMVRVLTDRTGRALDYESAWEVELINKPDLHIVKPVEDDDRVAAVLREVYNRQEKAG